jgi:hypothetical protein
VRPPSPKVQDLARRLVGTAGDGDVLDEVQELNQEECEQLDYLVFECTVCNWWFAQAERAQELGDWTCTDCAGDKT